VIGWGLFGKSRDFWSQGEKKKKTTKFGTRREPKREGVRNGNEKGGRLGGRKGERQFNLLERSVKR